VRGIRAAEARLTARPFIRAAELFDARFKEVAESIERSQELYVVLDGYGRILGLSVAASDFFGYEPQKLIGRRLAYRVLGAKRGKLLQALIKLRNGEPFQAVTVPFHRKNGPDTDVVLALTAMAPEARGTLVIVVSLRFESALPVETKSREENTPRTQDSLS